MCVLLQLLYYSFSSLCNFDPICNIVIYFFFSFKFCNFNMCFVNKRKIILKKKKKKNAAKAACLSDLGDRLVTRGDWVQVPL